MKDEVPSAVRRILPCLLVGAAFTFVMLMMMGFGVASRFLRTILWPGLHLVEILGYGINDWHASVLVVVGNSLFYGAILFVVMLFGKEI